MMKCHLFRWLPVLLCAGLSGQAAPQTLDLKPHWDAKRVLKNPEKGWYHHLLDNGVNSYAIRDEAIFRAFPGMDHLYLRLAWSYLEPEEGKYDWHRIDEVVQRYVPLGYKIAFRLMDARNQQAFDLNTLDSGNLSWLPDQEVEQPYQVTLPRSVKKGEYRLKIKLFLKGEQAPEPVAIGLKAELADAEGFSTLGTILTSE